MIKNILENIRCSGYIYFLICFIVGLIFFAGIQYQKITPEVTMNTLNQYGYSSIKLAPLTGWHYRGYGCGKSLKVVDFYAVKNDKNVEGYVCHYLIFDDKIVTVN